jgi:hypothetical protein
VVYKEHRAALDAERVAHAKEIANFRAQLAMQQLTIEASVEMLDRKDQRHIKQVADLKAIIANWESWHELFGDRDREQTIIDLRQRIAYLEGQQGLEYFDDCGKYWCCPVRLQGVYLLKNESMAQLQDDQKGG